MNEKLIDLGLICMRNEAEDIRGWAKESLFFCRKVIAIIDPETSDDTEKILRSEFPQIFVQYQDRELGDSDDGIKGPKKQMRHHLNYTKGLQEHAIPGDWIMEMAPDERLVPSEFDMILEDIKYMQLNGYDGLVFPNYFTPIGDLNHVIDWYSHYLWGDLKQVKFWKYKEQYEKGAPPHSNQTGFCNKLYDTDAGFYHFCYVKDTRIPFSNWRDVQDYKFFNRTEHQNPFPDWKNMPELDHKGEFKN